MSLSTALISVDVVAFRLNQGCLQLLTRRQVLKSGEEGLVLPAGRIEPEQDQSLDDTARRLLGDIISKPASYYEQVITIGDSNRDTRGWSLTVVYYALLTCLNSDCISDDVQWVDLVDSRLTETLAYDHEKLVYEALGRFTSKIQYSSLPIYLLPNEFTLSDIQKVFSTLLGKAPPMRSIRNRFLQGELLEETGKQRRGSCRPAALYRINRNSDTLLFDRLYLSTQH
ncbi:hypothetical protein ACH42_15035 [Endozoicomonas sp. (ex Bugula neritina AB1)]|nr:hypothetical protein ACH42_15035 [Endozoicomonas sp. (ex Bugula neritina AB1)]